MTDQPIPIKSITSYPVWPSEEAPPPGSFGLSRIGGLTGKLIAAGQAFSGDASRWTHAFIVLDKGEIIEAQPGGARIVPITERLKHDEVFFTDKPIRQRYDKALDSIADGEIRYGPLTDGEAFMAYVEKQIRADVVTNARQLEGTGYGYLQYLALGLVAAGFRPNWLKKYIASKGRMICSQMCDEVYRRSGIQLFDDGRLPQEVTPGDLAIWAGAV